MRALQKKTTIVTLMVLLSICAVCWGANWLTEGGDPQRTGWQRDETILTTANAQNMKLLWKIKLNSQPRQMHNLFPPLIVDNVTTASGPKQIAVVAGVSDNLFGIDVATGKLLWTNHFTSNYKPPTTGRGMQGGTLCPGGQTANPVVGPTDTPGKYTIYALGGDGRLRQVNVADGKDVAPPANWIPGNTKAYSLNLFQGTVYTMIAQGCGGVPFAAFSYNLATKIASGFLPQGGGLWGRRGVAISPEGTIYAPTGDGPPYPDRKNLGEAIVALKLDAQMQLRLAGYFLPPNALWMWHRDLDFQVTPAVFDYQGHHFLVDSTKECKLYLLDRDNFGGADHRTSLYTTPRFCNDIEAFDAKGIWGALATWQDPQGTAWVVAPFYGPVSTAFHAPIEHGRPTTGGAAAFKVVQQDGKWRLDPAWLSVNMDMGEEAVVANGIVFVFASGENTHQQRTEYPWNVTPPPTPTIPAYAQQSANRIVGSTHATLYALDGETGKVLWSSGDQITSWNHFSGISEANGRVYIGTYDGNMYCFGIEQQ